MKKYVDTHFPLKSNKKGGIGLENESRDKNHLLQYEFTAHWLASGLAHYQITRDSPSGLYLLLKNRTNVPVSSPNAFDGHVEKFLAYSTENMENALKGNWIFVIGDSSPDRMKRKWISFGVSGIDRESNSGFTCRWG